jgi:peptidoglycan/xylan/chitin deacetylase (PgdA/CDA1 family)
MVPADTPYKKDWRAALGEKCFAVACQTGLVRAGRGLWRDSLTVLNYHRIADVNDEGFDSFKPNVSATPGEFSRQMDYVTRWFNVVSLPDVTEWLDEKRELPAHAALITFDDGYLDNFTSAYPILRRCHLPAVVFLVTGHIERDVPFYWDLVAYCFHHARRDHITLPDGRNVHWTDAAGGEKAGRELIEQLKSLPDPESRNWAARMPEMLDVSIPAGTFRNLMMSWDQIREMSGGGIEFGGHTMNHPILTRLPVEQAKREIVGSKERIEQELGKAVLGFAYPNGSKNDFNREIERATAEAGYRTGFTLLNGPLHRREVKRNPFAIRRNFISHKHSLPKFAAIVSGFNRYRPG